MVVDLNCVTGKGSPVSRGDLYPCSFASNFCNVGYGVTANIAASHLISRQLGVRLPVSESLFVLCLESDSLTTLVVLNTLALSEPFHGERVEGMKNPGNLTANIFGRRPSLNLDITLADKPAPPGKRRGVALLRFLRSTLITIRSPL